ncbi:helix-turn-helix domain-containing protein [Halopseudomonas phragmitis]|uniref:HTH araC/xylS-type domain-containing protein n=1 Tax=Halopseudomonas phragmitis TaxID=1931241 RepID=A0A1V0B5Q2_9GAMM|nr:AraC family transcriptional regulator [Halopseudomonas phragmitis]AQZ95262.1 hypothetical protein BVH74_11085 [Halopseudomonas phragmitis]
MNQVLHPLPCQRLQERAFWAKAISKTLEQYGKSAKDLPADLRHHCSPEDHSLAQISQTDMNRLWHSAAVLSGDECFGLKLGKTFCSNTLKVLGLAATSSETIGTGIRRIIKYISVFSTQVQLYSVEDDQYLTIYFEPKGSPHPLHLEALVGQCSKIWKALDQGPSSLVLETRLVGDHEKTRQRVEDALNGRVRLGAKRIAVRLNQQLMRVPLETADAFLSKRLDASLEDMLGDLPNVDFAEQVKQRIRVLVAEREISEELVATPFNMSPRHLRRKLSETHTTYEKLLDEVRMELAIRLIQDGKLNLGRIAFELGFLDPSSFTRAFRRWTGMSPTAFRDQGLKKA